MSTTPNFNIARDMVDSTTQFQQLIPQQGLPTYLSKTATQVASGAPTNLTAAQVATGFISIVGTQGGGFNIVLPTAVDLINLIDLTGQLTTFDFIIFNNATTQIGTVATNTGILTLAGTTSVPNNQFINVRLYFFKLAGVTTVAARGF